VIARHAASFMERPRVCKRDICYGEMMQWMRGKNHRVCDWWIDGLMDGWMDGWRMDGWMDGFRGVLVYLFVCVRRRKWKRERRSELRDGGRKERKCGERGTRYKG